MTQSTQIQTQSQNSKAVASLVSGVIGWVINLGLFFINAFLGLVTLGIGLMCLSPILCGIGMLPFIGWLVAIITGHLALGEIKRSGEKGHGMAVAGLVLGYTGFGLTILLVILIGVLMILGVTLSLTTLPFLTDVFNQLNQYQWYIPYH
jgi:predicted histidine transporter YuiF (NhaC family)